jgi:hypothetical protein
MIRLDDVRIFVHTVDYGSFSGAARQLNIAPAHVGGFLHHQGDSCSCPRLLDWRSCAQWCVTSDDFRVRDHRHQTRPACKR